MRVSKWENKSINATKEQNRKNNKRWIGVDLRSAVQDKSPRPTGALYIWSNAGQHHGLSPSPHVATTATIPNLTLIKLIYDSFVRKISHAKPWSVCKMSGWRRSRFINVSGSRPEFSMPVDGEVGILTLPRRTSSHLYFCVRMIKEKFALVCLRWLLWGFSEDSEALTFLSLTTRHVAKSRSINPTVPKRRNLLKSFAEYARFYFQAFCGFSSLSSGCVV